MGAADAPDTRQMSWMVVCESWEENRVPCTATQGLHLDWCEQSRGQRGALSYREDGVSLVLMEDVLGLFIHFGEDAGTMPGPCDEEGCLARRPRLPEQVGFHIGRRDERSHRYTGVSSSLFGL